MNHILFLGGGNMATALIGGLVGDTPSKNIHVIDPSDNARQRLQQTFGVTCYADAQEISDFSPFSTAVLAVKPQHMKEALAPLSQHLSNSLVISIAAGLSTATLSNWLKGHTRIVRAMPNTPALIGQGITGLFAMRQVASNEKTQAQRILASVGEVLWVKDEAMIDSVTAISGSGPAYVFLFLEALFDAATAQGFDTNNARRLAIATVCGAGALAHDSENTALSTLRERVTSKGGTTAAALDVLAEKNFKSALIAACAAARDRSIELGKQSA